MKNKTKITRFIHVFFIFSILIIILSFPLILKITTCIPGFFSTDEPYAVLWESWRIKYSILNNIPLKVTPLIAYPFGVDVEAHNFSTFLWRGIFYAFSFLSTPVLSYNIQVLLNLLLSVVFTYLLVLYLTGNRFSAVFGGIIFAFCPYQFMRVWQHFGLTFNQWIPLCLFTAIAVKERSSRRNLFLFLISILLLFSFDYVIMYITSIALATFLVYVLLYNWKIKFFKKRSLLFNDIKFLKNIFFIGLIAFIFLFPQFLAIFKNIKQAAPSDFNLYLRPFGDLFSQSARPLSYFFPASVHPIFGKFTARFIGSPLYGISFTEHSLYLGWIPLILAFFSFRRWGKNKKLSAISYQSSAEKEDFYIGFFVFLAIVAWFFSQPPWWKFGPIKIYMPAFFMYKLLPMFRAYCRFGIAVILAVAVLAGWGLKFVLDKFRSQKSKFTITVVFCGIVLFEFWNYPPFKVIDVSTVPKVYYWLMKQDEKFAIAEYPLNVKGSNNIYRFYQIFHHRPIINDTIPGTYANDVAKTITRLSDLRTAGVLKWMGVRYVLVHKEDYLNTGLVKEIEELNKIPQNQGLRYIKSFPSQECSRKDIMCVQKTGPIDVYEVMAGSIEPVIH